MPRTPSAKSRRRAAPAAPRRTPRKRAAARSRGPVGTARIRMYRQGLGDCFLLTLPRSDGGDFHMLIDCGVLLGTENKAGRLRQVVQDVIRATGGHVDVFVVTHEHYDHVAGLLLADDLFTADAADRTRLSAGEVWFGWTEDPDDPLAQRLRADREAKKQKLAAMLMAMTERGMAATPEAERLAGILGFFGIDFTPGQAQLGMSRAMAARAQPGKAKGRGDTGAAMDFARSLAPGRVHYRRPGEPPWQSDALDGLRIYVLGPPLEEAALRKADGRSEVYHFGVAAGVLDASYAATFGAAAMDPEEASLWADACPFEAGMGAHLPNPAAPAPDLLSREQAEFLRDHYAGPPDDPTLPDQDWRRIDGAWGGSAALFALKLDAATNNTSLVLAIEIGAEPGKGPVLLFPGDAQVGSWLSWQDLAWSAEDGAVTGPGLLARTAFYKVGHHGSHNATARAKGLEMMPASGLLACIPVDDAMAARMGWHEMPLASLVAELNRRTGDRLIRMDRPLPEGLAEAAAAAEDFEPRASGREAGEDPLYYELTLDLAAARPAAATPPAASPSAPAPRRGRRMGFAAAGDPPLAEVTAEHVRRLFPDTPIAPIRTHLGTVLDGLRARGLTDRDMLLMALATIRAETEGFLPIDEGRSPLNTRDAPFDLYEPGTGAGDRLGNTHRGDGPRFKGRGFVQLTGRENYTRIGPQVGADLVARPGLANDPVLAGLILAQFLQNEETAIRTALKAGDLLAARKLVNGGSHGFARFKDAFERGCIEFP